MQVRSVGRHPASGENPTAPGGPISFSVIEIRIERYESDPNGTRTRVAGVKGRSPRPLDDGAAAGIVRPPASLEKFLGNRQVPSAKLLENGVELHKTENRVQKYLALQYNDNATMREKGRTASGARMGERFRRNRQHLVPRMPWLACRPQHHAE